MVQSKHFQRRGLVELKFISLLIICCVMKTSIFTRMFCWKKSIIQHVSSLSLCVDDLLYVMNGTFANACHRLNLWMVFESLLGVWVPSIRLVYEVATSHRANLILEYASPPPARRFKWRRKWEVASPCVQIWDATCTRWMTPSSTTVMLGASQGTLLERPPS